MAIPDSPDGAPASPREAGKSLYEGTLDVLMTGIAIIVPLVITLYVLQIVLEFITNALVPFIELLQWFGIIDWFRRTELVGALVQMGLYPYLIGFLTELITLALLLGIVIVVGSIGRHRYGERAIEMVDLAIAAIPGFGTVYKSFRRMGDVMLDNEAENFQEIKLVQCFDDDIYVIGFETSTSPETIANVTGHDEMVTLFIPLAPNPVTGGFLTHVPKSRVMDIDMTIEEGVRSILTSGVATGESASDPTPVTMGDLEKVTDIDRLQDAITTDADSADADSADESR
ncbi:DUF502 domain-containing protein [Saliphagus sp. GCM10025308]